MLKQLILAFALIAAAQASFIYVYMENIVTFKGMAVYIRTKGFIAYEGGPTEWSAGFSSHPGTAKTLTTQFSGITVNNGGIETDNHLNAGITVNGNYWGAYDLTQIKSGSQSSYYAVCHSDSDSNYCGSVNWQYMTNFAMDHI